MKVVATSPFPWVSALEYDDLAEFFITFLHRPIPLSIESQGSTKGKTVDAVDKQGCSGTVVDMSTIQPLPSEQNAFTGDISFFEIQ